MKTVARVSSMLRTCGEPDCATFTLGRFCVAHEPVAAQREFVRGRPFVSPTSELPAKLAELPAQLLRFPKLADPA